ncbi:hypothetical protein niasHT_023110 [Heterodera trifolii]|uniref:glutaminase n=1 Tax=Heterodera trifolii TaxID=157864 RepID=A0ABD2KG00_9BILA
MPKRRVGILALQGNVQQHCRILNNIGAEPVIVKTGDQLDSLDGLILPGGESTTMFGTDQRRRPILGTCAGLIILAKTVRGSGKTENVNALSLLDVVVQRNAYGTQANSAFCPIRANNGQQFCASFIRAPSILHVGKNVHVLAKFVDTDEPVAVQQDNIVGLCFHPENCDITYFHELLFKS